MHGDQLQEDLAFVTRSHLGICWKQAPCRSPDGKIKSVENNNDDDIVKEESRVV
jgi:hypothetical protein